MVHSVARANRGSATLRWLLLATVFGVILLPLSACAVLFGGTTQTVPVDARPGSAEVFVDGASAGFTPLELELARNRSYRIDVRYAGQVRTFELRSGVQDAMVGLDLVPVGVAGGLTLAFAASAGGAGNGGSWHWDFDLAGTVPVVAVMFLVPSVVPIAVDFGTGAIYQLTPGEILAVFD